MDDQKQVIVDKLKAANNILVTVSTNPSVDQLAACIGLTILLNKQKKHASAVFSGQVPSTIEFLKPEDTLEKNTDSLRDFIISLDKSKADKLRYKVEENVVKIFITPYKTSISQDDLEFSQGDFNVDVVLALGVHEQQQLDEAITTHGRILHDAVVITINTAPGGELGSVNWTNPNASSLSELAVAIAKGLDRNLIDGQIATAFLTGIVAETGRFSNEKTSPETMKLSAELLTAGANQQLVASELGHKDDEQPPSDQPKGGPSGGPPDAPTPNDGTLEISHPQAEADEEHLHVSHDEPVEPVKPAEPEHHEELLLPAPDVKDVKQNNFENPPLPSGQFAPGPSQLPPPHYLTEPPRMGGELTANTEQEGDDDHLDVMGEGHDDVPLLERDRPMSPPTPPPTWQPQVVTPSEPPKSADVPEPAHEPTLVKEPVKDVPDFDAPLPANDPLLHPTFKAGSFEPLASEPHVAATPQSAPDFQPAPEPPKLNDQIHIDPDGNIQGGVSPGGTSPDPLLVAPTPSASLAPSAQPAATPLASEDDKTLVELEKAVHSPHVRSEDERIEPLQEPAPPATDVDAARNAVMNAINGAPPQVGAKESVGAGGYLKVQDIADTTAPAEPAAAAGPADTAPATFAPFMPNAGSQTPAAPQPVTNVTQPSMPLPPAIAIPKANPVPPTTPAASPTAPPPVPPPMTELPPFVLPNQT